MTSILSSIQATVASALSGMFFDATLTRDAETDDVDPAAPSTSTFSCKALVDDYSDYLKMNGVIKEGERRVLILAGTLSTRPIATDRIAATDATGVTATYNILEVKTDPAVAVWECKSKP